MCTLGSFKIKYTDRTDFIVLLRWDIMLKFVDAPIEAQKERERERIKVIIFNDKVELITINLEWVL